MADNVADNLTDMDERQITGLAASSKSQQRLTFGESKKNKVFVTEDKTGDDDDEYYDSDLR